MFAMRYTPRLIGELSKVGTVCVSSASTGLCGGCRVTGIPTATRSAYPHSGDRDISPNHLSNLDFRGTHTEVIDIVD